MEGRSLASILDDEALKMNFNEERKKYNFK